MKNRFILSVLVIICSCNTTKKGNEPQLSKIIYEYHVARTTDFHKNVYEGQFKQIPGLYRFLSNNQNIKDYYVIDAPYEKLILSFEKGKTFTLESCHRLFEKNKKVIATDYGITPKGDVNAQAVSSDLTRFKNYFNKILTVNCKLSITELKKELQKSFHPTFPKIIYSKKKSEH
jgi:hypothetical protein